MDQFTKRYVTGLAFVAVVGAIYWASNIDPRVSQLNDKLFGDEFLANYPYQFRVIEISGDVARMHSPRSSKMSAIQGLRVMYPELRNESPVSDRMMSAQEDLARHQSLAARLVTEHPEIDRVAWVLDETWLRNNGVVIQ